MKFDGSNWVNVGPVGFTTNSADYASLAFSNSGEPYMAFIDGTQNSHVSVMKFNGSSWALVGNAGFSTGTSHYPSLAFSNTGEPYVAFKSSFNNSQATVMKYDGSAWVAVGSTGFSSGWADYTSLAFNSSGVPYVAFEDINNSYRATVMKFGNGTSSINSMAADNSIEVYPNPANDYLNLTNLPVGANIKINDAIGKNVYDASITTKETSINTSAFTNGIYHICIEKDGVLINKKLVINK
ncbi:MAG: T9SS type A sorting domain-containing protein [Bacteroidota bacterium]|nr:MAG: T9SS type A sorting domain-containing protein [Bacteroidota bacterium]